VSAISVQLAQLERDFLVQGLIQWSGATRPTEAAAGLVGFASLEAAAKQIPTLAARLTRNEPMASCDWGRALAVSELMFASDRVGAGVEWEALTGLSDGESVRVLRTLQRKLCAMDR
jgi:hypothetical protein